jgi:hypothetical protein
MTITFAAAHKRLFEKLNEEASSHVKALLETKHLYQRTGIDAQGLFRSMQMQLKPGEHEDFAKAFRAVIESPHFIAGHDAVALLGKSLARGMPTLTLTIGNVKTFCVSCGAREPHAPVWCSDISNEAAQQNPFHAVIARQRETESAGPQTPQFLALIYQCQNCAAPPVAFLLRSALWEFSIHGRSPIQTVEVPKYIPKVEAEFHRDATIAWQTGRTLAALFYLRVLIEQFARRQTGLAGRETGDEIMDAYAKTIPQELRSAMPSLREWFDRISDALHSARKDDVLFENAQREIDRHFDMRRVHNLADAMPVAKNNQTRAK